jgi:hypothetical protein
MTSRWVSSGLAALAILAAAASARKLREFYFSFPLISPTKQQTQTNA